MQFITDGPDIPERLLQIHEEGKVVFFCGAGISLPAGLPDFACLVNKLYESLGKKPDSIQKTALKAERFDTVINLLEEEITDGRGYVRQKIADILKIESNTGEATSTHEALLTLGKNRKEQTRLITTNFDRIFEEVIKKNSFHISHQQAPLLPVPNNRWDGLVYLHGLLSENPQKNELNDLVVSSGDFGLAYLVDGWAARFVRELFRNFTVCFVGYSVNDAVLRYMMDAFAANRLLGESLPETFAFGSFSEDEEEERADEWRAKNVTPILYREDSCHVYLHRTLRVWSETYRDGVSGKKHIVYESALRLPRTSTKQDDFVGRMMWALSDPGGLPAKSFAEMNPVPSLDWLEPLSENCYSHADLNQFGIASVSDVDNNSSFSLLNRPAPYSAAPAMAVVNNGHEESSWDKVMWHLARWLIRHLGDPALLHWMIEHGGHLHYRLFYLIEYRLLKLDKLENDNNSLELDRIRANAPNGIPSSPMRTLWRLLLSNRIRLPLPWRNLSTWFEYFRCDGLTTTLRLQLRDMMTPYVSLRKPFLQPEKNAEARESNRITKLVNWKMELSSDNVHYHLKTIRNDANNRKLWNAALPKLFADFSGLLHNALDLMRELGDVDDKNDLSYIYQPSISEHSQNKKFHDWIALIELTRDAWLALAKESPERAILEAENWWNIPYPLFRRLSFFAAAQDGVIPHHRALDWLLADDSWWLWAVETRREVIRLLVALAPHLDAEMFGELEHSILSGPPHEMFRKDIKPEDWTSIVDKAVWLRLAKIKQTGAVLSMDGKGKLDSLSTKYPNWGLWEDERDEFFSWMGDVEMGPWKIVATPRSRRELVEWLKENPDGLIGQDDDWNKRCRDNFPRAACALYELARENFWPKYRWHEALLEWSPEEKLFRESWRCMAPVIIKATDEVVQYLAKDIGHWLQTIAKTLEKHEDVFFRLSDRILSFDIEGLGMDAINHPVGRVTEALLIRWNESDGRSLSEPFLRIFTSLCDTHVGRYRNGRELLATRAISLFRVAPDWTRQYLLPLFDWKSCEDEALAVWRGFLWTPRLYLPLLKEIKFFFLETARHYEALGSYGRQYASLLTVAALDTGDTFEKEELREAIRSLPEAGHLAMIQTLIRGLEGSGEQHSYYWVNRVAPFFKNIWPKEKKYNSPKIAEDLCHLCLVAKENFPKALSILRPWFEAITHSNYPLHLLNETDICQHFPHDSLDFLESIIKENSLREFHVLGECLKKIIDANPELKDDDRYKRLSSILQQHDTE